jgi:hypothetical protein
MSWQGKTLPVFNCRLENVVDKAPLHALRGVGGLTSDKQPTSNDTRTAMRFMAKL